MSYVAGHTIFNIMMALSIAGLLFQPAFAGGFGGAQPAFAQNVTSASAQLPSTQEEALDFVLRALKLLPGELMNVFQDAWGALKQTVKQLWAYFEKYIWSWAWGQIQGLWHLVLGLLGQEIEKRKPIIEQELEKEKQELKQEARQQVEEASQGLWERFKEFIKSKL